VPDYGVVADVSETLRVVLTDALSTLTPQPSPIAEIHDLQGTISTSPARLTLFLFEVTEDPSARNRPPIRNTVANGYEFKKPPLALILRYLLTPWSGSRITDHQILGRAMQVLYDDAILSGFPLQGSLAGTDQALKLTLTPLTLEERTRVWHAVQKPYRLSVTYEVRVVNLDALNVRTQQPVRARELIPAVPEEELV